MNFIKLPHFFLAVVVLLSCFVACKTEKKSTVTTKTASTHSQEQLKTVTKASAILDETIKAHGGELYNQAHYQFTFRNKTYRFKNNGTHYTYESLSHNNDTLTEDILENGTFSRKVNGEQVTLSEKKKASAIGAINSVIYFATLPHKLNDPAVNVSYVEKTTIKGQPYEVLKVTFSQDGGGEDFEDEYHYWINQSTKKVDFLAYNYHVNGGGVRFRSAYNVRVIDGITFQDYINYKAEVGTPLKDLPALYEADKLKEVSKIETQNIINLNKQS